MGLRNWTTSWPVYRQLTDGEPVGRGAAAGSRGSRSLHPRPARRGRRGRRLFLLLDEPQVYRLPPDPVVTTRDLPSMWRPVGMAARTLVSGAAAFLGRWAR